MATTNENNDFLKDHGMLHLLYFIIIVFLSVSLSEANTVQIADFGAIPGDGKCDREAIQSAINEAIDLQKRSKESVTVHFESGVYNLHEPNLDTQVKQSLTNHVVIKKANEITLIGKVSKSGGPGTVLERNVPELTNRMDLSTLVFIKGGNNVTLQNIALDNNPRFTSAGKCVKVDKAKDVVEVDVFEGVPHFDKMDAFSANIWDLKKRDLKPGVPHLSIGTNYKGFPRQWIHVPGGKGRRYRIEKMGFAKNAKVGDGVSWHFDVHGRAMMRCHSTDGLTLKNIWIKNGPGPVVSLHNVGNLTCKRVALAPAGNQLAVGPRDGMYTAGSHGDYLYEECVFSGVRWDPLPLFDRLAYVEKMIDSRTAEMYSYRTSTYKIDGVDALLWLDGKDPMTTKITSHEWGELDHTSDQGGRRSIRRGKVTFADDVPQEFGAGAIFTPIRRTSTIIRNCTFENNYGRSPYLSGVNMLIENNTFRNNGYAFALGVSSPGAGGFVHNVRIRNNTFENCAWSTVSSSIPTSGAIRFYEDQKYKFSKQAYHSKVLIENNTFKNVGLSDNYAAIDIRNARKFIIRNNEYIDTRKTVQLDPASTDESSIQINDK